MAGGRAKNERGRLKTTGGAKGAKADRMDVEKMVLGDGQGYLESDENAAAGGGIRRGHTHQEQAGGGRACRIAKRRLFARQYDTAPSPSRNRVR